MEKNTTNQGTVDDQTTVEPHVPTRNPNMLLFGVGGVILLGLGLIGGYFLWGNKQTTSSQNVLPEPTKEIQNTVNQTSNDTINWRTYINSKYNYSVQFPQSWRTQPISAGAGEIDATSEATGLDIFEKSKKNEYPNNVITLQVLSALPTYGLDWKKSQTVINNISMTKYEKQINQLNSVIYAFQTPDKNNSIEMLIRFTSDEAATQTLNQILSTFKFTDQNQAEEVSNTSARQITYAIISGWNNFNSTTGYSLQYPPRLSDLNNLREVYQAGKCSMTLSANDGGNWMLSLVVPYNGGSRRELYGVDANSSYQYEDVTIQARNALIIEKSSKSGTIETSAIVVPDTKYALIISWQGLSKNSQDFQNLLKSIKIDKNLDATKCS